MSMANFLTIWLATLVTMLICRVLPILLLKRKPMPAGLLRSLGLIPPAAFAALVANDLFSPTMFENGLWGGVLPLLAAAIVLVVARKTGSLIWCALAGVAAYAALTYIPL